MSSYFLWIGLTLIVGVPPILAVLALVSATPVIMLLGGLLMIVGCILLLAHR